LHGWQANRKTHLCVASSTRAMPENEIPPAMRVDFYWGHILRKTPGIAVKKAKYDLEKRFYLW